MFGRSGSHTSQCTRSGARRACRAATAGLTCAMLFAFVLIAAGACSDSEAGSASDDGGSGNVIATRDTRRGERLYEQNCAECHGDGDRLPIAPLSSVEFLNSRGDATLLAVVTDGKGTMPAFGEKRGGPFTDDEVRSVVAYMNASAGRSSTTLLAATGEALYTQHCLSCHGPTGDRIPVAPLDAQGFLDALTESDLLDTILNGTGTMKGFADAGRDSLTPEDATALSSFLRFRVQEQTVRSVSTGRDLYVGNCLACHGTLGDRVAGVELALPTFLAERGDGAIISAVTRGTESGPAFGTEAGGAFTVPDTAALLAYLKSWAGLNATAALSGGLIGGGGQGEASFVRSCAPCHGQSGSEVPGVQLKSEAFLTEKTYDVVRRTVAVGNDKGMPAWSVDAGGPLTDEQIDDIVGYLFDLTGATSATSSDGDAASPFRDRSVAEFFGANCAGCHGVDRSGGIGPSLLPDALPESDELYLRTILEGRPGTPMPAWGEQGVTEEQAAALVDFLRDEAGSAAADEGDATAGPSLIDGMVAADFFDTKCAACHGSDRSGGIGPALLPDQLTEPADVYVQTILEGRPGTPMPAWSEQGVSEDEARALVDFLTSDAASGETDATADVGPLIDGLAVAEFFGSKCAACHGADRSGGVGPSLLPEQLTEPDDFYVQTIVAGRPGTPMPAWGEQGVTEDDARALVEFLKSEPDQTSVSGGALTVGFQTDGLFGRELFEGTCALCHGLDGLQIAQCPIGSSEWLVNTGDSGLRTRIGRGKPAAGMPAWSVESGGPLVDAQIESLAAYLWTLSR